MPSTPRNANGITPQPRYHRGGWELRVMIDGKTYSKRIKASDTPLSRENEKAFREWYEALVDSNREDTVSGALVTYYRAKSGGWSPSTRANFRHPAKAINDALGDVLIFELTPRQIQKVYDNWLEEVKPATVKRRHNVLSAALTLAERQDRIVKAPTAKVELPKIQKVPVDLPSHRRTADAIARLPKSQRRLRAVASLALASGGRRGEVLALRWSDVNFEAKTLRIVASLAEAEESALERKGTKSGSVRTISLDDGALADLKVWHTEMVKRWLPLGIAVGEDSPVFPSPTNGNDPCNPHRISQDWNRHREDIGLTIRFHDLRHRHATTLLEAGVPVHEVARRLGHASPTITLQVYAHAIAENDSRSADAIAAAMRAV